MKKVQMIAAIAAVLIMFVPTAGSALTKTELKCASKLPKAAGKLSSTYIKETTKCRNSDISGKEIGACPNVGNSAKIDKASAKLLSTVEKSCTSTCAKSGSACISSAACPADPTNPVTGIEGCNAGAKGLPFEITNLGFPGGVCPALVGDLETPADVGDCIDEVATRASEGVVDLVYGTVVNATGISSDAASCLSSIAKSAAKVVSTGIKSLAKCRDSINKGKITIDPTTCLSGGDPKATSKLDKAVSKLTETVSGKCTNADILELDLCGNGVGGTASIGDAQACLEAGTRQAVEENDAIPVDRGTSSFALAEAVYPPTAVCGDNVVNQLRNAFLLMGEECDGTDDSACPGECIPAGDRFECSCGNVKRIDFITNGTETELDTGWRGLAHDSETVQDSGFFQTLTNCDCTLMDGAECIGASGDPVCDAFGMTGPRCSWDPNSSTFCDDHGNGDTVNTDSDCIFCDAFSANAGAACTTNSDCTPQCVDAGGVPNGSCPNGQTDCGSGETCRGACDSDAVCLNVPLAEPTPLSSGGTGTCLITNFREDVTGTTNIVTGERETRQILRTIVHLGPVTRPCPVCGGVCAGGSAENELCQGTCSTSGDACRFDTDCPGGETCTENSPECPDSTCSLELVCNAGPNEGLPCRIGGSTDSFGTVSSDCPPNPGGNISGDGLEIGFDPSTTEPISLPYTVPCTTPGFELYDCPCPAPPTGLTSLPNDCNATCDAGTEIGTPCGTGNSNGQFTVCSGGVNAGAACDEDADCPGAACDNNPTHCTGDPAFEFFTCATNSDCGLGICGDACPGGRCTKYCSPDPSDAQDGICTGGPTEYHCDGAGEEFRSCGQPQAEGGCSATCSIAGTPCFADTDCPGGESCDGSCIKAQLCEAGVDGTLGTADDIVGAGNCIGEPRNCFLDPIVAEGGDIFNGQGDPTNVNAAAIYCIAPTTSPAVNNASGLGGAGRVRSIGVNVSNGFTTLP